MRALSIDRTCWQDNESNQSMSTEHWTFLPRGYCEAGSWLFVTLLVQASQPRPTIQGHGMRRLSKNLVV